MLKNYIAPTTKNIADLEKVNVTENVRVKTATDKDGKEFTYNYIERDGEEFRVPNTVLDQVKGLLEEKPDMVEFKVKKSGEGLNTKYQVIAL